MKSGNLKFLEPSGPLQACSGTALAFFFTERTGTENNFKVKVKAKSEEYRLRVFKNRVMRRCEQKGERVRGGWRKLYHEGPHELYFLPNVKRVMKSSSLRRADERGMLQVWEGR